MSHQPFTFELILNAIFDIDGQRQSLFFFSFLEHLMPIWIFTSRITSLWHKLNVMLICYGSPLLSAWPFQSKFVHFTEASLTIYHLEECALLNGLVDISRPFWWIILVIVHLCRRLALQNLLFLSCSFTSP